MLDAVGARFWPYYKGRDAERTPMPWNGEPGGGFTPAGVRPWLPMADPAQCNVADQEGDPPPRSNCAAHHRGAPGQRRPGCGLVPVAPVAGGHMGLSPAVTAPPCC